VIQVLTIQDDIARIFEALEAGAIGYLVKPVSPARLLEAIAEAHAGGSPMSSQIARLVAPNDVQRSYSFLGEPSIDSKSVLTRS
jgi:DNA-binding NarL/FixJ family response regulator